MKQIFLFLLTFSVSACSTQTTNTRIDPQLVKSVGTVISVKSTYIKGETLRPSLGGYIGSGGYRGVYGGIDVGNVVRTVRDANSPRYSQRIIIRQANGDTVAITQISREPFKVGDPVKIVLLNGEARVIH